MISPDSNTPEKKRIRLLPYVSRNDLTNFSAEKAPRPIVIPSPIILQMCCIGEDNKFMTVV